MKRSPLAMLFATRCVRAETCCEDLATEIVDSGHDFSFDPKFTEANRPRVWSGPVYFRRQSELYMMIAVIGIRGEASVSVAEVKLELLVIMITAYDDTKRRQLADTFGTTDFDRLNQCIQAFAPEGARA